MYGLLDGQIVPQLRCSFMNFHSSSNSSCERDISFPGSDDCAPGFNSIMRSQIQDGGNSCDPSSLNTGEALVLQWYGFMFVPFLSGVNSICPMKYRSLWECCGWFTVLGIKQAFLASCHRPWGSVCAGTHISCATGQESVIVSVYESGITPV
jgi:hypothetical protein